MFQAGLGCAVLLGRGRRARCQTGCCPSRACDYGANSGHVQRNRCGLVHVYGADQLDAMVSDVANIDGQIVAERALEIEGPGLHVRSAQLGINSDSTALGWGECRPRYRRGAIAAGGDKWENAAV